MSNRRRGINDDWICCSPQKFIFPTTSRRNPIYICFYLMAPTSTTRWSRTADAGGIGSMRWGIQCWKGWRKTHAKRRKACGLILHPSRLECTGKRGEGNPSTCQTLCRWARNPKVVRLPVVRHYWERYGLNLQPQPLPTLSSATERVTSTTDQTVRTTAKLHQRIEWRLIARLRVKTQGIEWRGTVLPTFEALREAFAPLFGSLLQGETFRPLSRCRISNILKSLRQSCGGREGCIQPSLARALAFKFEGLALVA